MKRAFTLIELLVVIAIIAILAAILFPVFAQAKRAAKATVALSELKQLGTACLMYAGDVDDLFPLDFTLDSKQNYQTWQGLVLPYTKSWQIIYDPLLSTPSGTTDQVNFIRVQHYGMPLRAAANKGAASNGYFSAPSSIYWSYPSGSTVKVDGIAGAGIDPASVGNGDYSYTTAPSLSQTAIANVSDSVMISQSGMWDMWWGIFSNPTVFRFCGGWRDGSGGNSYMINGVNWTYAGPHARKQPMPNGTTQGDATGAANGCAQPNGQATYVAVDGSAKSQDWRGKMTQGTLISGTTYFMNRFWPAGS